MDLACLTVIDLLSVFNKMTCRSLCQMQQTCKWVAALQATYRRYTHHPSHKLRVDLKKSYETFGFFSFVQNEKSYPVDVPSVMEHSFTHVEFVSEGTTDRRQDHCSEEQTSFLMKVFSLMKWAETHIELQVNVCLEVLEVIQTSFVTAFFLTDKLPDTVRTHGFQMDIFEPDWHPLPFVEKCIVKSLNIMTMISSLRTVIWDWYNHMNNSLTRFETGHWCQAVKQSREQILRNVTGKMFPWLESAIIPHLPAECLKKIHVAETETVSSEWAFLVQRPDGARGRISFLMDERDEHKGTDAQRFLLHRLLFIPNCI